MDSANPQDFFDLSSFAHRALFEKEEPVWAVLQRLKSYLLSKKLGEVFGKILPGASLIESDLIFIGKGTVVEPGACIFGPCIIGEDCQIRHGAYIRGNVLTGNRCVIGHATEVKNAIFFDDAKAGHLAYVGDSILGARVNLGAGTKCANVRFDKKIVTVTMNGKKVETGLKKFGAIFGDDAQTGCNAVTNPGTLMGKGSRLGPCAVVKGVVPQNHTVKAAENVMML